MAYHKDKNRASDAGMSWGDMQAEYSGGAENEPVEVRILGLELSASKEEVRREVLRNAPILESRFRNGSDCNLMYLDFASAEDAQSFVGLWHAREWRGKELSVVQIKNRSGNQGKGKKRGSNTKTRDKKGGNFPRDSEENAGPAAWCGSEETSLFGDYHNGGSAFSNQGSLLGDYHNGESTSADYQTHPWLRGNMGHAEAERFQDGKYKSSPQGRNGYRGGNMPRGGGSGSVPRSRRDSGQSESSQPEGLHQDRSMSKWESAPRKGGWKKEFGRRLNGPSPKKVSSTPATEDLEMPPLESAVEPSNGRDWTSPECPMPALEKVRSPEAGLTKAFAECPMVPLETATNGGPRPPRKPAAPNGKSGSRDILGVTISNFASNTTERELGFMLVKYKPQKITMINNDGSQGRTLAFVMFKTAEDAKAVVTEYNDVEVDENTLKVKLFLDNDREDSPASCPAPSNAVSPQRPGPPRVAAPRKSTLNPVESLLSSYTHIVLKLKAQDKYCIRAGRRASVMVTHVQDDFTFWAHDIGNEPMCKMLQSLHELDEDIQKSPDSPDHAVKGGRCAAFFQDCYYRAWTLEAANKPQFKVFFLDFGNVEIVSKNEVKLLPSKFWNLPPLAQPFRLKEGTTEVLKDKILMPGITLDILELDEENRLSTCKLVSLP